MRFPSLVCSVILFKSESGMSVKITDQIISSCIQICIGLVMFVLVGPSSVILQIDTVACIWKWCVGFFFFKHCIYLRLFSCLAHTFISWITMGSPHLQVNLKCLFWHLYMHISTLCSHSTVTQFFLNFLKINEWAWLAVIKLPSWHCFTTMGEV